MFCCGKSICSGCFWAPVYDNKGNEVDKICPFCRAPASESGKEDTKRLNKRMKVDDPIAIYTVGCCYQNGLRDFPRDMAKALELWHRAAELGNAAAYNNIGTAYYYGEGAEIDKKKAQQYYELAAMAGDVCARHNLGNKEDIARNTDRSLKHHMIAVRGGYDQSLEKIRRLYTEGYATKEDYTEALRSYQAYLGEIKSPQRDKAAAHSDKFRYY